MCVAFKLLKISTETIFEDKSLHNATENVSLVFVLFFIVLKQNHTRWIRYKLDIH